MIHLYLNKNRGKYVLDMIESLSPSDERCRFSSIIISEEELEQYQTLETMINLLILKLKRVKEGL